jgi:hypothetical protein
VARLLEVGVWDYLRESVFIFAFVYLIAGCGSAYVFWLHRVPIQQYSTVASLFESWP